MKLPRDRSGRDLAAALRVFGYRVVRETGSHLCLSTTQGGEHHITIPDHDNLRVGTLAAILAEVADHMRVERQELVSRLFG